MATNNDYQPLQHYLKNVYSRLHVDEAVDGVVATEAYKKIVGDLINKLTTSIKYKDRRLYVTLASAALRNELSYKRQSLTEKINEAIGRPLVSDIIFR